MKIFKKISKSLKNLRKNLDPNAVYFHFFKHKKGKISCLRLHPDAKLPKLASVQAAGMDLYAVEACSISSGARALINTGLAIAIPEGYHLEIRPRSGLALKFGVTVLNSPGTIDSDYRGQLQILLINHGEEDFMLEKGDRIAQAVLIRHAHLPWKWVKKLPPTARGQRGWGHSGVKD